MVAEMKARAIGHLMQLSPQARLEAISGGLAKSAENVAALDGDIDLLCCSGRGRGLRMLAGQADEEAAKALILLDLVRTDRRDHEASGRVLGHFYDHLARCIYAEVTRMAPADFVEVRRMVASMRPSLYLDGPEGIEWILRNRLLAGREEGLYVDYVTDEDGERWVSPAEDEAISFGGPSPVLRELIGSLARLGAFDSRGLAILADTWEGVEVTDETRWPEVVARNRRLLGGLLDAGLAEAADEEDARRVIHGLTFPLSGLDLSELKVPLADLEALQERFAPLA